MIEKDINNQINKLLELESNDVVNVCNDIEAFVKNDLLKDDLYDLLEEIFTWLREYYIDHDSEMYVFSKELNSEVIDKINGFVKNSLFIYDAFSIIRSMSLNDSMKLLDDIFENCILRQDFEYYEKTMTIGNKEVSNKDLERLVNAFRTLVFNCVSKLMNANSIENAFYFNTRIDPVLINSIIQNIDSNFTDLRINYIVMTLKDLNL